jgi:hypothetical protein
MKKIRATKKQITVYVEDDTWMEIERLKVSEVKHCKLSNSDIGIILIKEALAARANANARN